ncbi:hypothetical protein [Nonomuraea sediminis]|nr:hypothetical protein [Nonomuraea sediminis]
MVSDLMRLVSAQPVTIPTTRLIVVAQDAERGGRDDDELLDDTAGVGHES